MPEHSTEALSPCRRHHSQVDSRQYKIAGTERAAMPHISASSNVKMAHMTANPRPQPSNNNKLTFLKVIGTHCHVSNRKAALKTGPHYCCSGQTDFSSVQQQSTSHGPRAPTHLARGVVTDPCCWRVATSCKLRLRVGTDKGDVGAELAIGPVWLFSVVMNSS